MKLIPNPKVTRKSRLLGPQPLSLPPFMLANATRQIKPSPLANSNAPVRPLSFQNHTKLFKPHRTRTHTHTMSEQLSEQMVRLDHVRRGRWLAGLHPGLDLVVGRDQHFLVQKARVDLRPHALLLPRLLQDLNVSAARSVADVLERADLRAAAPRALLVQDLDVAALPLVVALDVVGLGLLPPQLLLVDYLYVAAARLVRDLLQRADLLFEPIKNVQYLAMTQLILKFTTLSDHSDQLRSWVETTNGDCFQQKLWGFKA